MQNSNIQKYLPIGVGVVFGLFILSLIYYIFSGNSSDYAKYLGADTQNNNINNLIGSSTPKIIESKNDIPFTPRIISGGGQNWVISLLETQPKIFTGKILYNEGVDNAEIVLDESNNILNGAMKTITGIVNARFEIINGECTDTDGNVYEYNLNGTIGKINLKGCGGKAIKINSQE